MQIFGQSLSYWKKVVSSIVREITVVYQGLVMKEDHQWKVRTR